MAVIKCKMCGGDLALQPGSNVAECEYCGSLQTVPTADNEKKLNLFARANRLRLVCEFDKAAGVYETIAAEFPEEAESYWGLVLCKYGIEYVDDPATGKKIPTCHRSSFDSVLHDSDFAQAMENSDATARRVYREEAKRIEELRRSIVSVSANEAPYDIFICYKETDEQGNRTLDSVLSQDIYDALTEKGYKVFFSRISLEDKLGTEYEPYIFAALNSAKIMLAVGTDYEYYNAVWVKNEWSRYVKLMAQDKNKHLIPCYKGLDAYDIPPEFSKLQGQDLSKVGAMQDLLRGIEKLLPRKKQTEVIRERVLVSDGGNVAPLLRRVVIFLEDRDWDSADKYCEKVLDMDPENSEAYLGKLMAEYKVSTEDALGKLDQACLNSANYQKALRFGDETMAQRLENIRRDTVYYEAKRLAAKKASPEQQKNVYREAIAHFQTIPGWRDSRQQIETLCSLLREMEEQEEAARQEKQRKAQLAREQEAERKRQAEKKARKTAHALKIGLSVLCAVVALAILVNTVVLPMLAGKKEDAPAANATRPAAWETPVEETEATEEPVSPEYIAAANLLAQGKTAEAAIAFGKLGDYRDARERSLTLWKKVPYRQTVCFEIDGSLIYGLQQDGGVNVAVHSCEVHGDGPADVEIARNHAAGYENIVSIQSSRYGLIGLRSDGTLELPNKDDPWYQELSQWTDIVHFSVTPFNYGENEYDIYYGVRSDGTVVACGDEKQGTLEVGSWTDIVCVSSAGGHTLGLKSDGTVVAVGENNFKQCDVTSWTDIIAVYTNGETSFGLKSDGTAVYRGWNPEDYSRSVTKWKNVSVFAQKSGKPYGLLPDAFHKDGYLYPNYIQITDVSAIISGQHMRLTLKHDGTVWEVFEAAGKDNKKGPKAVDLTDIQIPYLPDKPVGTLEDKAGAYAGAESLLAAGETAKAAIAFGKLGDYQDSRQRSLELWKQIPRCTFDIDRVSAVGLKNDGTVIVTYATSDNDIYNARLEKVKKITSGWRDIVSVNADADTLMGLRMDGKVEVAYGDDYGETADAYRIISSWEDVVYFDKCVALKADGTVIGKSINTEWDEKELTGWRDVVALSVSSSHVVGVKSDGTVLLAGTHPHKESMLGWKNVKAVYAGTRRTVGLKSDGTVLICGFHNHKEPEAEKWTDIVAINSDLDHTVGLKSNGRVVALGSNGDGQCQVDSWTDIVAIDAGSGCTVGLRSDGTLLLAGNSEYVPLDVAQWSDIQLPAAYHEDKEAAYSEAESLLAAGETAKAAIAFGKLGDYSDARDRSFALWRKITPPQLGCSNDASLAVVKKNGTVRLLDHSDARQTRCLEWKDILAVSSCGAGTGGGAGEGHTAGLKKDGTVVAVGANQWNQCDTSSWTDIVAIDTYALYYTVGLKADGTVVYSGQSIESEHSQIHQVSSWKDIISIRILGGTVFGIRSDGTVVTAVLTEGGKDATFFEDWSDIISVTRCGVTNVGECYIGLKADGTVTQKMIRTKYNPDRTVTQTAINDIDPQYDMSHWSEIIAVAAQHGFVIGLKADGTAVSTGLCNGVPLDVSDWSDLAAVYASRSCAVGLKKDGSVVSAGETKELAALIDEQNVIALPGQLKTG